MSYATTSPSLGKQPPMRLGDCLPSILTDSCRRRRSHAAVHTSSATSNGCSRDSPVSDRTRNTNLPTDAGRTHADKSSSSDNDNPNSSQDDHSLYLPHQPKSLAGIAIRSFCLGIALTLGLISTLTIYFYTTSPLWRLPFFFAALSLFHFLEFWTTAAYNTRAAEVSSFLLTSNWPAYAIAHSFATLECLVTHLLWPNARWAPFGLGRGLLLAGWVLVVLGQTVRSVAMIQAGRSFNHLVQYRRQSGHVLVTTGIYGVLRHPSYFGFFWWALGTQMVMGNLVSFVGYAVVLWRFFSSRIQYEEELLVAFFGEEYINYRRRVRTLIPLVP